MKPRSRGRERERDRKARSIRESAFKDETEKRVQRMRRESTVRRETALKREREDEFGLRQPTQLRLGTIALV